MVQLSGIPLDKELFKVVSTIVCMHHILPGPMH